MLLFWALASTFEVINTNPLNSSTNARVQASVAYIELGELACSTIGASKAYMLRSFAPWHRLSHILILSFTLFRSVDNVASFKQIGVHRFQMGVLSSKAFSISDCSSTFN